LLFLLFALILILVPLVSLAYSDGRYDMEKARRQDQYTAVTESYMGLGDWVITRRRRRFVDTASGDFNDIATGRREQKRFERWRNCGIQMIFALMVVALIVGADLRMTSSTSIADFAAAVVLAVFPLVDCFIVVSQAVAEVPLYTDSLDHLNDLTERVESRRIEPSAQTRLEGPIKSIVFDHVSFSYGPDDPLLLDDFSLRIEGGQRVALLGPSGEGKTTVLQ
ncbi:MAG: thiol reductant ABC exporter subunit CydC, partial [Bifidobacteriales bacterium]|nr:thiol reductant ABC exporter subunit CydC [Bifidobacteriales bacterium]